MKTLALKVRGRAPLAALLILAATTTIADARVGMNPGGQLHNMTPSLGAHMDRHWGSNNPPPAVYSGPTWQRPTSGGQSGGGGTGGFSPGGGSGTTPKGKPKLQ